MTCERVACGRSAGGVLPRPVGGLPSSLAISLHEALRSGILWTVSRSCPVSLPWALGTAFTELFFFFPDIPSSDLPGPANPALRVSGSHIHPYMYG